MRNSQTQLHTLKRDSACLAQTAEVRAVVGGRVERRVREPLLDGVAGEVHRESMILSVAGVEVGFDVILILNVRFKFRVV